MGPLAGLVVAMILGTWLVFALATFFEGFPKLRIHQVLGIVALSAFALAIIAALELREAAFLVIIPAIAILLMFAGMWSREFRLLMLRRADEFPDRTDKLAWIFVLTAMAPAGVWLFRSYRRARWPEVLEAAHPHPLDAEETSDRSEAWSKVSL